MDDGRADEEGRIQSGGDRLGAHGQEVNYGYFIPTKKPFFLPLEPESEPLEKKKPEPEPQKLCGSCFTVLHW